MPCDSFKETELKRIFSYFTYANNLGFYACKLRVIIHITQANLLCRWLAIMSITCTHLGRSNVLIGKTASHVKLIQVRCKGTKFKEKNIRIEKHKYNCFRRV
jgi:hypothetical protein